MGFTALFIQRAGKKNSRNVISMILHSPATIRAGKSLLPRPSTGGCPQDVGVLDNYAPRCKSQNTKLCELRFRAVLGGGTGEVRFERVTLNSPNIG